MRSTHTLSRLATTVGLALMATACTSSAYSDERPAPTTVAPVDTAASPATEPTTEPATTEPATTEPETTEPTGPPVPLATGNLTGSLPDGATWVIDVPADWNGTALLYSHGLVPPGEPNPAVDAPDPVTSSYLLDHGYALVGSSYASTGFAVEDALTDQLAVLDVFAEQVGTPTSTIAWGSSLGGMVTASLLEQHPDRFDGGASLCGVLGGSVELWNSYLDVLYTVATLIAPDAATQLVNVADPSATIDLVRGSLFAAQQTPEGRARIALAASVGDIVGWAGAGNPRPAADDAAAQEQAQFDNLETVVLFGLALRADMEARAGGNPSSNVGVDYAEVLAESAGADEVAALYQQAGLDLEADLAALAAAPRISADSGALAYVTEFATFTGALQDPLVTLHNNGDQLVAVGNERDYRDAVESAGASALLSQMFVERAGHCIFTPAETLTALDTLLSPIDHPEAPIALDAASLNARASGLGPDLNVHFEDDPNVPLPTDPAFADAS